MAVSNAVLASKFRGCMLGTLLGDCLGYPFEGCSLISNQILNNFIIDLMNEETTKILPYTDDTCMTLSVASSLIEKEEIDVKDLAKRFTDEYYRQPKRGYGLNVSDVFKALRESDYEDVFLPAKRQFHGDGSYGNGAAMRIAPIALFGNSKGEKFIMNAAEKCSLITHAHANGYNGAILQCLAVNAALGLDSSHAFDPVNFISNLQEKMENVEMKNIWQRCCLACLDREKPYCESLKKMKLIFLQNQEDMSSKEIAECLGHNVAALRSVPTAIYSFLRGMKPINDYECSNPFLRTLYFAISVGGDTDTIASMAGSIAGAYYGADVIPEILQKRCEFTDGVIEIADKLFDVTQKQE